MYYPLHVHTAVGSIGDSVLRIEDYVSLAAERGLSHLAITDHGSMSAMYQFTDICEKYGIKPIIGMEAYEVDDADIREKGYYHLVLLAKNKEGLENLLRIHNDAQTRGFYYKPRTDRKALSAWGKGIIALSACVAGSIPQAILEDNEKRAFEQIAFYKKTFDDFFLEIQPGTFDAQKKVNDALVYLAQETDIPLVVTNDIHYLRAEDYLVHDYHVKLGRKVFDSKELIYPDTCYYFMTEEEIKNSFIYTDYITEEVVDQAVINASLIAKSCNVQFDTGIQMPVFCDNSEQALADKCDKALEHLLYDIDKEDHDLYQHRLDYELDVIVKKGFCDYFLIVQDYVNWAINQGIAVGPGRGSAAGSLVAYLLGITQVNPIKYGLLFERFLDPNRQSTPDVDIDLLPERRDEVVHYLQERYGYDHCAQISAIHTRKAKGAVKDAVRVLGYDADIGDAISKLIPTVHYDDEGAKETDLPITVSLELVNELRLLQKQYPDVFELAIALEGLPSSMSVHAAGIIIGPHSLSSTVPLIQSKKEGILATSLTLDDAEKNYVKFDLLSLDSLSVIAKTQEDIHRNFDYEDDTLYDDPKVWEVISSPYTVGIFQIGSTTYRQRMPRLRPSNIEELSACLALIRGPSISAKTDEIYMQIVEGKKKVPKLHPIYDEITKDTNGIILYQEQIMHLAVGFGMSLSEGYQVVKNIAKKKSMDEFKDKFLTLAGKKDCSTNVARKIWYTIEAAAAYCFNKSHSIAYALLAYNSAWLKYHYTLQYMKNLLTDKYKNGKTKEYAALAKDCKNIFIDFLPPSINQSEDNFTIEDKKIRIGLCAVKGLGTKAIQHVLEVRKEKGGFDTFEQFLESIEKKQFNKNRVIISIFAGLFDEFLVKGATRKDLYVYYVEDILKEEPKGIISVSRDLKIDVNIKGKRPFEKMFFGAHLL